MSGTTPAAQGAPRPDAWLSFVRHGTPEGRGWAEDYLRFLPLESLSGECLRLLHAGRRAEAAARLDALREALDACGAEAPTRAVLERWYHGVDGYRHYAGGGWDEADRAMVRAADAVAEAVERLPALLPLAVHCHELRLHRARIARNRRRWDEMFAHVEAVREMFEGRAPFCRLAGGGEVGLAEVLAFYRTAAPLDDALRAAAEPFLDGAARIRAFERFVRAMYRLPGFVLAAA